MMFFFCYIDYAKGLLIANKSIREIAKKSIKAMQKINSHLLAKN